MVPGCREPHRWCGTHAVGLRTAASLDRFARTDAQAPNPRLRVKVMVTLGETARTRNMG